MATQDTKSKIDSGPEKEADSAIIKLQSLKSHFFPILMLGQLIVSTMSIYLDA